MLSPGVRVRPGAVVRDSVVFNDCEIGSGATVERAILDKNVVVGEDVYIGFDLDHTPDHSYPDDLNSGTTLVGKNTRLPVGLCIGRNCVIGGDLTEDDFMTDLVASGQPSDVASESALAARGQRDRERSMRDKRAHRVRETGWGSRSSRVASRQTTAPATTR